MANTLTIVRMWCKACDAFTWHTRTSYGHYECLQCRSQGLEDALKDHFIILAQ